MTSAVFHHRARGMRYSCDATGNPCSLEIFVGAFWLELLVREDLEWPDENPRPQRGRGPVERDGDRREEDDDGDQRRHHRGPQHSWRHRLLVQPVAIRIEL